MGQITIWKVGSVNPVNLINILFGIFLMHFNTKFFLEFFRRKQNFGPKANFKKRKTKLGDFKGFPKSTQFIQVS